MALKMKQSLLIFMRVEYEEPAPMQMGDFNTMSIIGLGFGNQTVQVVAAALADIFVTIVSNVVGSSSWVVVTFDHC